MGLNEEEKTAIINYRIERAKETLKDAKDIAQLGKWYAAANRLYYACYYAVNALLMKNNSYEDNSGICPNVIEI
jgi:uncharacterized protein (UPF0332 family)